MLRASFRTATTENTEVLEIPSTLRPSWVDRTRQMPCKGDSHSFRRTRTGVL